MRSPSPVELENVIAHRGASYDAPENTRASIDLAISRGIKIIEFDVRQTNDGGLFLFHDEKLERLCGRKGFFADLDSVSAAKLDVGSWFTKAEFRNENPPRLAEAITQCIDSDCVPLIERKTGGPECYAKVISDLSAVDRVIVQSFDWKFLEDLRQLLPDLCVGALGKWKLSGRKSALLKMNPDWVGWTDRKIGKSDVLWLKEQGFHLAVFTVNDPERARFLLGCGVDKIITDRGRFLKDILHA